MASKSKIYAVKRGRQTGIFATYDEVQESVKGFSGAAHKSFRTREEAMEWLGIASDVRDDGPSPTVLPTPPSDRLIVYTDGSSVNYQGGYGIVALLPTGGRWEVYGPCLGRCTNNRAELTALEVTLRRFNTPLLIRADSTYAMHTPVKYYPKWKRQGDTDHPNYEQIERIWELLQGRDVTFEHVEAHTGEVWNELADGLANLGRVSEIEREIFQS